MDYSFILLFITVVCFGTMHAQVLFNLNKANSAYYQKYGNNNNLKFKPEKNEEKTSPGNNRNIYPGPFMRFLIAVNATEGPCVATAITPTLQPRVKYNMSDAIHVGDCDHGPLLFDLDFPAKKGENMTINLTFHSSVIEDASPPTCQITWNGSYLTPPPPPMVNALDGMNYLPSLLPGCFTMDSREGFHMTYYWFYLLSWGF